MLIVSFIFVSCRSVIFNFWLDEIDLDFIVFLQVVDIWYEVLSDYQGKYHPQEVLLWFSCIASLVNCIYCTYVFTFTMILDSQVLKLYTSRHLNIHIIFSKALHHNSYLFYFLFYYRFYLCLISHSFGFYSGLTLTGGLSRCVHVLTYCDLQPNLFYDACNNLKVR